MNKLKKSDILHIDWNKIQELHDSGENVQVIRNNFKISGNRLNLAIDLGLFIKRKRKVVHTEEVKRRMSETRKKWLSENRDKHPWRKSSKFKSVPCEQLKTRLREANIEFEEEVIPSDSKNYSVDILIKDRNLIVEVNGNQHYDGFGKLRKYYQDRHDHLVSLGWTVLEVHYSLVYSDDIIQKILSESVKSETLPFRPKGPKPRVIDTTFKDNFEATRLWRIDALTNSNIDFSKFGWVGHAAKLIKVEPQTISRWMRKNMPEFYATCYHRGI
jgi:very-short-patch-repair endonuclease